MDLIFEPSMPMILILIAQLLVLSNESLEHSHTGQPSVGHMVV
jgi:hypothetical protein